MAKLQRNAAGKLVRNALGKIIRATRCCCGEPPVPGCNRETEPACVVADGAPNAISDTYKVTIEGVTFCPSAGATGDSPNRDYYVLVGPDGGGHSALIATLDTLTVSGATTENFLDFALAMISGERAFSAVAGSGLGNVAFSLDTYDPFGVETYDPGNVCGEETSFPNDLESGDCATGGAGGNYGYGGTITFTPCPPCAVDCEGSPCAAVGLTGGSHSFDPGGEYATNGRGRWSWGKNSTITGIPAGRGPAGCYWAWAYTIPEDFEDEDYRGHILQLYVWYDGKHYRGMLTRASGATEEVEFLSAEPGDVTCTEGVLAGTLTLESDGGATVTVTLGECDECDSPQWYCFRTNCGSGCTENDCTDGPPPAYVEEFCGHVPPGPQEWTAVGCDSFCATNDTTVYEIWVRGVNESTSGPGCCLESIPPAVPASPC